MWGGFCAYSKRVVEAAGICGSVSWSEYGGVAGALPLCSFATKTKPPPSLNHNLKSVPKALTGDTSGVDKFEPVSDCGDMDDAEEALGELVVTGCDSAVDFHATKEAFDVVSFTVERPIMFDLYPAV